MPFPPVRPFPPRRHRVLLAFAVAIWLGIVVKAASCSVTWDESWTFLHYTRRWSDLFTLDYANNHPLNSLLIHVCTALFGVDSELVIRLPNVGAAAVFLLATLSALPHVRHPRSFFVLAVCQPYLLDYLSIARGYGIAAACVQLALVWGFFRPSGRASLPVLAAGMVLAGSCIFPMAIASLVLMALLVAARLGAWPAAVPAAADPAPPPPFRAPGTVFWPVIAGWVAASLLALLALKQVSRPGVPVFGSADGWYRAVPISVLDKNLGAAAARWLTPPVLLVLALLAAAGFRRGSPRTRILLGCGVGSMAAIEAAAVLLHQPLPTDRVLIPWYPLWTLSLLSAVEDLAPVRSGAGPRLLPPRLLPLLLGGACVLAILAGLRHLDFRRYEDWPTEAAVPGELAQAMLSRRCLPPAITLPHDYYLFRWFGTTTPPGLPPRC